MKDSYIIQSLESDIVDLAEKIHQLEKIIENLGKKIAKQQDEIDSIVEKLWS